MLGRVPEWKRTVHCIGDLHAAAITDVRLDAVSRDIERLGTPALRLQIGDATEAGTSHQDELAPDRTEPGRRAGRLLDRTLAFLERELQAGPDSCWIACHFPLFRTVMGDPRLHCTSVMDAFHAKPDREIRGLLARHRNAKLWLSGHTHSPLSAPGLIKRTRLSRRRTIVAINTSALVGIGRRRNPRAPLCSLYLTPGRDRLEIRARDHCAGSWRNIAGWSTCFSDAVCRVRDRRQARHVA
jgi:hypothetical protein